MKRIGKGGGFSVLDGAALVVGAAIASIHILGVRTEGLSVTGWLMIAVTFSWVAVTAAGPFIFLARRFARPVPAYPNVGDRLWAMLGIPWLVTALLQSAAPDSQQRHNPLFTATLSVGLAVVCMISLVIVWGTWVMVRPEQAADIEAGPWTNRVGLILSIAWPIQCGLGLVVSS
jgi:hypothetical protein